MTDAYKKAAQVVKQLKRQRANRLREQGKDQKELAKLLERKEELEDEIESKYSEIKGENLSQLLKYDQLIRDAEASRDRLLV